MTLSAVASRAPGEAELLESAFVGVCLKATDNAVHAATRIYADHFLLTPWANAWRIIRALTADGVVVDLSVLMDRAIAEGLTGVIPSLELLQRAAAESIASNYQYYFDRMVEMYAQRQFLNAGIKIGSQSREFGPVRERLSLAVEELNKVEAALDGGVGRNGPRAIAEAALEALEGIRKQIEGGVNPGLPTGIRPLDEALGGLRAGELIFIGGRPGMGKTALALNIALNVSAFGYPVGYESGEMRDTELATRIIAARAGINSFDIRKGALTRLQFQNMEAEVDRLCSLPLFIRSQGGMDHSVIIASARRAKVQRNIRLLVGDYLQLITSVEPHENETIRLGKITTAWKHLAGELGLPAILLSAMSRDVDKRTNKRPVLADLRQSGSIEQDADIVLLLYRDDYYHKDSAYKGITEVEIAKFRAGPTSTVYLGFDGKLTSFFELPPGMATPNGMTGVPPRHIDF